MSASAFRIPRRPGTRAAWCAAVVALVAASARADTIVLGGGKPARKNVAVQKENCKEITFKSGGPTSPDVTLPAADVINIVYDDAPSEYKFGCQELANGHLPEATALFEKALGGKAGPWLAVYCKFYLGECAMRQAEGDAAQYDVAIGHYKAALAAQADSRFIATLKYQMAIAYRQKKDYANADATLKELIADVSTYGLPAQVGMRAELELARLLEADGKFSDAYGRYMSLAGRPGVSADVANLAKMRAGLCLVAQQKFSDAQTHFQTLLKSAGPDEVEVLAGATLGLGHCFFQQKDWVHARYAYLTVSALYGTSEYHAEALYHAAQAWIQREEQEAAARQSAISLFEELIVLHPKSPFEPKAFDEAVKLGANKDDLERRRGKK